MESNSLDSSLSPAALNSESKPTISTQSNSISSTNNLGSRTNQSSSLSPSTSFSSIQQPSNGSSYRASPSATTNTNPQSKFYSIPRANQNYYQPVASTSANTLEQELAKIHRLGTKPPQPQLQNPQPNRQNLNLTQNQNLKQRPAQAQPNEVQRVKSRTHQSFASALASDHSKVLSPDYRTAFSGVEDALSRLLPYHVYDVPDDELLWAIRQPVVAEQWCDPAREKLAKEEFIRYFGQGEELREQIWKREEEDFDAPVRRKRKREGLHGEEEKIESSNGKGKQRELDDDFQSEHKIKVENRSSLAEREIRRPVAPEDKEDQDYHPYPLCITLSFHERHAKLTEQLSRLQQRSVTSHLDSKNHDTSTLQLERLAHQRDKEDVSQRQAQVRELRSEAIKLGVPIPGQTSNPYQPQVTRPPAWNPASGTPSKPPILNYQYQSSAPGNVNRNPNHQYNQAHKIQPPQKPNPQGSSTIQRPPPGRKTNSPSPARGTSDGSKNTIPTQPIPLLIPLTHLARLTSLGINPTSSQHLLPTIASLGTPGLEALPANAQTAPKQTPTSQNDAAILLGISERSRAKGFPIEKMLHVSVVLTKFEPKQLSGLAALMQELQDETKGTK